MLNDQLMTNKTLKIAGALTLAMVAAACRPHAGPQDQADVDGPRLSLSKDVVDFGEIAPLEEASATVQIGNEGNKLLVIESFKASCTCVEVNIEDQTLLPGESTELAIDLFIDNYPSNVVDGRVFIKSNDPATPHAEVRVHAQIQPEYTVEPQYLDFGKVKRGQSPSLSLLVRQTGQQTLELERVETPPILSASVRDATAKEAGSQAEGGEEQPKVYEVAVSISPQARMGRLSRKLKLVTNILRLPEFPVPVRANIVGVECFIAPRVVVFGSDPPGAAIGSLEVEGVNDLEILEVTSTIEEITFRTEMLEPHKRHRIHLQLKDQATPGDKIGRICLTLREGELVEVREVSVYGTVKQD